tara:strand:+ start:399 stop:734 length:336 start_codon:yes stop_codon:yes gene_type:complete
MKCFIELWKAKDAWKQLSKEDRGNYVGQIGPHIQNILGKGVEIVSWGSNENTTEHRADYDFFAVWNFPNQELLDEFEAIVEGAGWYDYFEQVNLSGESTTPEEIIGKMVNL